MKQLFFSHKKWILIGNHHANVVEVMIKISNNTIMTFLNRTSLNITNLHQGLAMDILLQKNSTL